MRRRISNQANSWVPDDEVPGAPCVAQFSGAYSAGNPGDGPASPGSVAPTQTYPVPPQVEFMTPPQSAPAPSPAMTVTPEPDVPAPTPATETSVPGHADRPPSVEVPGASREQAPLVTLTQVPTPEDVGTGDSVSQAELPDEPDQVAGNPYWKFLSIYLSMLT